MKISGKIVAVAVIFSMLPAAALSTNRALTVESTGQPAMQNELRKSADQAASLEFVLPAENGSISTGYVDGSGWCSGLYLDLTAGASDVSVDRFDSFFRFTPSRDVELWWKAGSYVGSEETPGDWTLHDTINVVPSGQGLITELDFADIVIPAGQTYGIYLWDGGETGISGPNNPGFDLRFDPGSSASDSNLSMNSLGLNCDARFDRSGSNQQAGWQGTIVYSIDVMETRPVPTLGNYGLGFLVLLMAGLGMVIIRRS